MPPRPLTRSEGIWLLDLSAIAARQQASRLLEPYLLVPLADRQTTTGQTADLWFFAVSLAKFSRVLDRLVGQRPDSHPLELVRDEFTEALPDLPHVRNVLEHSEDYLRAVGGPGGRGDLELASMQLAMTADDMIMAIASKGEQKQRFLSVRAAISALDNAMEAIHGRRKPEKSLSD